METRFNDYVCSQQFKIACRIDRYYYPDNTANHTCRNRHEHNTRVYLFFHSLVNVNVTLLTYHFTNYNDDVTPLTYHLTKYQQKENFLVYLGVKTTGV